MYQGIVVNRECVLKTIQPTIDRAHFIERNGDIGAHLVCLILLEHRIERRQRAVVILNDALGDCIVAARHGADSQHARRFGLIGKIVP